MSGRERLDRTEVLKTVVLLYANRSDPRDKTTHRNGGCRINDRARGAGGAGEGQQAATPPRPGGAAGRRTSDPGPGKALTALRSRLPVPAAPSYWPNRSGAGAGAASASITRSGLETDARGAARQRRCRL